jgi:predicted methyltransferase
MTNIQPNSIIPGDCLNILPSIRNGSIDFILTDPAPVPLCSPHMLGPPLSRH